MGGGGGEESRWEVEDLEGGKVRVGGGGMGGVEVGWGWEDSGWKMGIWRSEGDKWGMNSEGGGE